MTVTPGELAATMFERHRKIRAAHLERAMALRTEVQHEAARLLEEGLAERAWLVGTLAWGEWGQGSDVDLVVEGLPSDRRGEVWSRLVDALDCDVDLLRLEELADDFRSRVLVEGMLLP